MIITLNIKLHGTTFVGSIFKNEASQTHTITKFDQRKCVAQHE